MLKEKINTDYMNAMREKNVVAKNLLSVVKGEIQTLEKNTKVDCLSDSEVIKILNKIAKSLKETISLSNDEQSKNELTIIESYLPTQMTKIEIEAKVTEIVDSGITNLGLIMKEFSNLPADKKTVSEVVKELVK